MSIASREISSIQISEPVVAKAPRNLSPQQQLEALRRAQRQAEQRVRLGMQLFKAAEARLAAGQDVVGQVRREQDALRDEMHREREEETTNFNKRIAEVQQSTDTRLGAVERQLTKLQHEWSATQDRMGELVARCQAMLDQTRHLVGRAEQSLRESVVAPSMVEDIPQDLLRNIPEEMPEGMPEKMPQAKPIEPSKNTTAPAPLKLADAIEASETSDESAADDAPAPKRPVFSQVIEQLRETG